MLQKLNKLKQTGDLDSYVEQFLFLMNQTRDVSVYTLILLLTENLNPYLAQEVKYRQPTILQAAIDIAKLYVSTHLGMTSNSTASLNYTATKQHHKWCSFHRVKTHDTSECRRNKPSSGNSKSNFSKLDSHSRINQFHKNKSHNQPFSSPNSKDNSFSNSFGQRKNWFKRKHQLNEKHQNIVEIDNQQQSCVNYNQIQQILTETNKPKHIEVVERKLLLTTTANLNNISIEVVIDTACSQIEFRNHSSPIIIFKFFQLI